MFDKILIANRGEIACRIMGTCRRLGIRTVAVYSDADCSARHVRLADEAVRVGPPPSSESYLRGEKIIAIARETGAAAIHPGYGFLAENAIFADACDAAGLTFVGPSPETIRAVGSKSAARRLVRSVGVPTVPGYDGDEQRTDHLTTEARKIGYPLMIKASAGGGGKGMRIVRTEPEFALALESARREAMSAFGDDRMLLERYLEHPRHIEFQIFGDDAGSIVHLFERECSIQRRYQKIIEESPSPFLDDGLREQMATAAVEAARAVSYLNAGTVEFIVSEQRDFYFMEMNTRLQVEHPVTELTTGIDLVEWQLRIAAGESLPFEQAEISRRGHAIEARLYAEDPGNGFLPSTGTVRRFAHPVTDSRLRIDSGVDEGDDVTIHYDPMIAKLIVLGENRDEARERLQSALANTVILGPTTNLSLLRRLAGHESFTAGQIDTGYIDTHLEALLEPSGPAPNSALCAAAARGLLDREIASAFAARTDQIDPGSPWHRADGWQLNGQSGRRLGFIDDRGELRELRASGWDGRYRYELGDEERLVQVREGPADMLELGMDGEPATIKVIADQDQVVVIENELTWELGVHNPYPIGHPSSDEEAHPGSPLPGRIVAVEVTEGEHVARGQALVVIEGMKMEYTVTAKAAGTIAKLLVREGDSVEAEAPLVDIITALDVGDEK